MTSSFLSHAVTLFASGIPVLPVKQSLLMTLMGLATMTLWVADAED